MGIRRTIIFGLSALGCILTVHAETWTYADCLEYARTHNISLKKSRLSEGTAIINLDESKAAWQPSLDFGVSQGFNSYPFQSGDKAGYTSNYGLNAGWTVWNGGVRENTVKRDKLKVRMAELSTESQIRGIETELLQIYLNILYARESVSICEEAVKLSEAQAERSRQLMEAGRASSVDYAQLMSQYEQDKYSLVNAQSTYSSRVMELKKLLELGIDTDIELHQIDYDESTLLASLPDMNDSFQLALTLDPQLQELSLAKEATGYDLEIAKAGKRPQITLNGSIGTGYNTPGAFGSGLKNSLGANIGLNLTLPIADNKKTKTAIALARQQQLDSDLDIDQRKNELSQEVENWYITTRTSQARYKAAALQLEANELSDKLTNAQFELGLVNPVELMTAHNNLMESRFTLLQSKYMALLGLKMIEYYRTAEIFLP